MTHRAIIETIGIAEQFKATWVLIYNHWTRSGEHIKGRALRTDFAVQRILRYDEIISRPRRAAGMGVPNDGANRLSILRHDATARCDVMYLLYDVRFPTQGGFG